MSEVNPWEVILPGPNNGKRAATSLRCSPGHVWEVENFWKVQERETARRAALH